MDSDGPPRLRLTLLPARLQVARLPPDAPIPDWFHTAGSWPRSATRTARELSLLCEGAQVPGEVPTGPPQRALEVAGPLAFDLTGILAALATPLAAAGIPIFALSTYDTDYVLVPEEHCAAAVQALRTAGHTVATDGVTAED